MAPAVPYAASSAHAVVAIFFLLGIASSLPFNVFITEQDYFGKRLKGTAYETSFVNWFSVGFNITTLLSMLFRTVVIGDRMPSAVKTVFSMLVIVLSIMLGHTVLTRMPEFHGDEFFSLTMVSIVIVGTANTMLQDGLLRLVSTFPAHFTQSLVAGQSMAGVLVSVSSFVILAASSTDGPKGVLLALRSDADLNAFVYFVFVFAVVLLSVFSFVVLTRIEMFRQYHRVHVDPKPYLKGGRGNKEDFPSREKLLEDVDSEESEKELYLIDLAYKIRYYGAAVFLVFMVTLSLFPGLVSLLHSTNPSRGRLFGDLFVPALFILVNAGDFVGRWVATSWPTPTEQRLFYSTLARLIFCPLIMFCNLQNEHLQPITLVLFKNDFIPILGIAICSFTNGLICTQALMLYPRALTTAREKEMGGTVMFFLLSLGLSSGSLLSFVFIAMLKP
ncbi:hypothetical protein Poli38472_003092 [Pythium oligandrum]|uniref:Equilibrative nucleoside transporter 1 n=1 Tax=Pythium oligandrum TaxID=41045 RepID=A0A8K1FF02_PYTOL|nr:hypothetical protein Poli38472_003092 [Pythium oligandrum]|eukprot:TMW57167.1 hypothetical protein Poli38472_003092 [Pythium oligandrum]